MSDNMMKIAGRDTNGKARAIKTDDKGNLGTQLQARNELITYATSTVLVGKTSSVINRFSNLKDYSAIVVAVSLPSASKIKIVGNWYIQKTGETNGTQVTNDTLLDTTSVQRFATGYLEIKGTQLTVIVANGGDTDIEATVYIMGIR